MHQRLLSSSLNTLSLLPFSTCLHVISVCSYTEHHTVFCSRLCRRAVQESCADAQSSHELGQIPRASLGLWNGLEMQDRP